MRLDILILVCIVSLSKMTSGALLVMFARVSLVIFLHSLCLGNGVSFLCVLTYCSTSGAFL